MKVQDIFCLIVRLSGYFTLLWAIYAILAMVLGPVDLGFKPFMVSVIYGVLGLAILKAAPVIGAFTYPGDPPA